MKLIQSIVMAGGYFLLLCEIRFEHRAAVLGDWRPWIPIVFCATMLIVIPFATYLWNRGGKVILIFSYCLTSGMGGLGVLFHSEGHFIQRLSEVFSVWWNSIATGAAMEIYHPPILAPAAFIGLGLIGFLFCISETRNSNSKVGAEYERKQCRVNQYE